MVLSSIVIDQFSNYYAMIEHDEIGNNNNNNNNNNDNNDYKK